MSPDSIPNHNELKIGTVTIFYTMCLDHVTI